MMLTYDQAVAFLRYEPESGSLFISSSKGERRVGFRSKAKRYLTARVCGKVYNAHRLIWLLVHGEWPKGDIDHINGDKSDNRLINLRLATRTQNNANRKPSKTGLKGAYKTRSGSWVAKICINYRKVSLGTFPSEQEAHDAYMDAARQHFGEYARAA